MTKKDWAAHAAELLTKERGFTVHPQHGRYTGAGYGVSPYPDRGVQLPAEASVEEIEASLRAFFDANRDILTRPQHYIGGWVSSFTPSPVYLDVAVVTHSELEAQDLQLRFDQRAIYSFGEAGL